MKIKSFYPTKHIVKIEFSHAVGYCKTDMVVTNMAECINSTSDQGFTEHISFRAD